MLKITHLIDHLEFGGVIRNLETLTEHLKDVEHRRILVSPRRRPPPFIPPDELVVVHFTASWSKLPFLAALRAMRGRAPIVIVEHSYAEAYERYVVNENRDRFRAMLRLIYLFCDRVVAVSHGQAAWLRRAGFVNPRKVVAIPSSTYCGDLLSLPLPTRRGREARPLVIGAYGRYHEQKGFHNLIRSMRLLPDDIIELKFAGSGPYDDELRTLAEGRPDIHVGGQTSDVAGFLASCDVVAVPSRWESFGQVALEARSAGRPLICSSVDGLVEQTGESWGWLVHEDNLVELAGAMREAISADIREMGKAARWSAEGHLDMSLNAWRDLATELLQRPATRASVRITAKPQAA